MVTGYPKSIGCNRTGQTAGNPRVPVCFSGEMRNSRGALTPAWPEIRKPCPARAALFGSRLSCDNGSAQPYLLTIVLEERSMSNALLPKSR
jgi:hypothetical protein